MLFTAQLSLQAQVVISDKALTSRHRHSSTLYMSSAPTSIGSAEPVMNYNIGSRSMPSVNLNSYYSPSGSRYSSTIYTPFTSTSPQTIRRTGDGDDDDEQPAVNPGDPGDPMPIGNGLCTLLLMIAAYIIFKQKKQDTSKQLQ